MHKFMNYCYFTISALVFQTFLRQKFQEQGFKAFWTQIVVVKFLQADPFGLVNVLGTTAPGFLALHEGSLGRT